MARSYTNKIDDVEVSLAIEKLLIADWTQAWTAARVDFSSLPTGFTDLGAVVEDTPQMRYSREKFQLKTGIPQVTQFESIMSMEGSFECHLHSNSWRKVQYALGNYTAVSSATVVSTITSVIDANNFSVFGCASLVDFHQYIFAATSAGFDTGAACESRVTSITSSSTVAATIHVSPTPFKTPVANWVLGAYDYVRQVFGGSTIKYYKLLGVADFVDGVQIVHQLFKASPAAEFTEAFKPSEDAHLPLSFNALGVETTINSCTELVVGDRYYFPTVAQC